MRLLNRQCWKKRGAFEDSESISTHLPRPTSRSISVVPRLSSVLRRTSPAVTVTRSGAVTTGGGEPGGEDDDEPTAESRFEPSEPDVERRRGGAEGAGRAAPREGGEKAAGMCSDAVITQSSSEPPSVWRALDEMTLRTECVLENFLLSLAPRL